METESFCTHDSVDQSQKSLGTAARNPLAGFGKTGKVDSNMLLNSKISEIWGCNP